MNERETAVFSSAAVRLGIKSIDAPLIFGVTRQTFSCWIRGKTKIPPWAFVVLVEHENRLAERLAAIQDTVTRVNSGEFTKNETSKQ